MADTNRCNCIYQHASDRPLSDKIMECVERVKGEDSEVGLYDDLNPASLNDLFREEKRRQGDTRVRFMTHGLVVNLWANGNIYISVREPTDEELEEYENYDIFAEDEEFWETDSDS